MTSKRMAGVAVAVAVLGAGLAPARAADPIKIGVAGPMTGANATFGEQVWSGAKAYADEVNAKGGVDGHKFELIKGDDACEPKQAVALANRFVDQDKVNAVLGNFCSSSTIPASNIYSDANILAVTPAATNPVVTDRGLTMMFRACGRDDQQAVQAADFIVDKLKVNKIALVHDKDTYGQGLVDALKASLAKKGVQPVLYEGLTRGEKDFNALVTKIKASGADVVYYGGLIPEAGPLIRQMKEQGLTTKFVGADAMAQAELVTAAGGPQFLKNVYYSAAVDPLNDPATAEVQAVLKKQNIPPANYTLYGYATMQSIAAAFQGTHDGNTDQLAAWLRANTVKTAMGDFAWDKKGDLKDFKFVFYTFTPDGKPVEIK